MEGNIQQLKQVHKHCFEVRLKTNHEMFADKLAALGCSTEVHDDLLLVLMPDGSSPQMLWEVAREQQQQIRYLRPQRSTLEEVFLKAMENS
jgi:ABC-2 type transport system ATP-binding protein